jgi:cytochrome c oxidase subunit 4
MQSSHAEEAHHVSYGTYVNVWLGLVALTAVTIGAHYLNLKHLAIFTAVLIATVKSTLVLLYFMHIRFEKRLFTYMILAVVATYAVFILLTFADYYYR